MTGPQGATKTVMIRAIGPSIGVGGALQNPVLELHDSAGNVIINRDWKAGGTINGNRYPSDQARLLATQIAPTDDRECAIIATVSTGANTAIVAGELDATTGQPTTGIGLVEVYDLDPNPNVQLANISTRGNVGLGLENSLIGGIIVLGSQPQTVLIRAIGPSLTNAGVANALQDPFLYLADSNGTKLASNDDWKTQLDNPQHKDPGTTGIPPSFDAESALLYTLNPGSYTAIVTGAKDANGNQLFTGVALVEAYHLQ